MATVWLPARVHPAKPPVRGACSVAALARRKALAGRRAACLVEAHGPGSASILHTILRVVSVSGACITHCFHIFILGGGCALPLTPFSPIGEDCTALPGIADVSCLSGECVVRRCMPGYVLSRDRTHCVSTQTHTSQPHVSVPEDEEEYMQAIRYGLEHRPF